MISAFHLLHLSFGIVVDYDLRGLRTAMARGARSLRSSRTLCPGSDIDKVVVFGDADRAQNSRIASGCIPVVSSGEVGMQGHPSR
jgi:hypothetical protein